MIPEALKGFHDDYMQRFAKIEKRLSDLESDNKNGDIVFADIKPTVNLAALEKETGESDEDAFEKWWNDEGIMIVSKDTWTKPLAKAAWLASRKRK